MTFDNKGNRIDSGKTKKKKEGRVYVGGEVKSVYHVNDLSVEKMELCLKETRNRIRRLNNMFYEALTSERVLKNYLAQKKLKEAKNTTKTGNIEIQIEDSEKSFLDKLPTINIKRLFGEE